MAFGPIFQLGYLVEALEPAIAHWVDAFGAGPFFVLSPRVFLELSVNGKPSDDRRMIDAVALGQLGELQIELIVPGPAPSTYHDFLDQGQRGLHHVGIMSKRFDLDHAAAFDRGYVPETEARTALTRIAYFRPPGAGSIVELVEHNDPTEQAFGRIREASLGWDGRAPVRSL